MDGAFRKIDIDAFDEDVLLESELYEPDPRDPSQVLDEAKAKSVAVRSSLSKCVQSVSRYIHSVLTSISVCSYCYRGDIAGALVTILENAPYGANVDEAKVRTALPSTLSFTDHMPNDKLRIFGHDYRILHYKPS